MLILFACLLACLVCFFVLEKGYHHIAQAGLELPMSPRKALDSHVTLLICLVLGFCVNLYVWLHLLAFL